MMSDAMRIDRSSSAKELCIRGGEKMLCAKSIRSYQVVNRDKAEGPLNLSMIVAGIWIDKICGYG
jgi:hypothetical protein